MEITLIVNGKPIKTQVKNQEYLADTLRNLGYLSIRQACNTSNCGLCSVWIKDKPILSCSYLAIRANNQEITTIEGVQEEATELANFLVQEGGEQCGFCSPGFIMTVLAMKKELTSPTEEEITHYLTGNLCRCTGYQSQLRAIKKYMGVADHEHC